MNISRENEAIIKTLIRSGRLPHTVVIEGDSKEQRDSAALMLSASAVCEAQDKPCLSCSPCRKIIDGAHPDLIVPPPSKSSKTGILKLEELREKYLPQAYIKPNEAPLRIYIFSDADRLLREDSQNTLLKIIEEPPQNILFIFTVEKSKSLLPTVLSRAHIITLRRSYIPDESSIQAAHEIIDGVISLYEYDLLLRLSSISDKAAAQNTLAVVSEKLRLALLRQSGVATDDEYAQKLARRLDRRRIIALTEVTHEAIAKLKINVNLQLLLTWLCTQYRRIAWQK